MKTIHQLALVQMSMAQRYDGKALTNSILLGQFLLAIQTAVKRMLWLP
jgi:hypothetical protein